MKLNLQIDTSDYTKGEKETIEDIKELDNPDVDLILMQVVSEIEETLLKACALPYDFNSITQIKKMSKRVNKYYH